MKRTYDRQSKRWLTDEEYQRKYKKRETCKGGREHDWVEVLPIGVEATPEYKGIPEPYYQAEEAIEAFTEKLHQELEEKHGIRVRYGRGLKNYRLQHRVFVCSVCKKNRYETRKPKN